MRKNFLKNKKGDIPITILVVGIVSLCILTLYVFIFSMNNRMQNFTGIGMIEAIYSLQQEIYLDKTKNFGQYSNIETFEFPKKNGGVLNVSIDTLNKKINADYAKEKGFFLWDKKKQSLVSLEYYYDD